MENGSNRTRFDDNHMNSNLNCYAITKSANLLYSIDICCVKTDCIDDYSDKNLFTALCCTGCINYNKKWSCPPRSPDYQDVSTGWDNLFVLFARMELSQLSYVKNDYLKIKAANSILKSRADKFLRHMAAKHGNYISTGSCRLCKPCKCKIGSPCAHPELMTYSFEAMGVDVGKLVIELFHVPLLWYKPHNLPEYTSVVCGLLTNSEITVEDLQDEYMKYITN